MANALILIDFPTAEAVNLATKLGGEDLDLDIIKIQQKCKAYPFTADAQLITGPGKWFGYAITSSSTGLLSLLDEVGAGATTFLCGAGGANGVALAAGAINMFPVGVVFETGLKIDINGTLTGVIFATDDSA